MGYLSVSGEHVSEKVIERSRFITTSCHVEGEDEARAFIARISSKFKDATHNCYAYIADPTGNSPRFSDDGEPGGTAGMPILDVIKNKRLYCAAVVVTRYFGGIKLGAGGLIGAYSGNVARALDEAPMRLYRPSAVMKIEVAYALASKTEALLGAAGAIIDSRDWEGCARFTAALPEEEAEKVCLAIADMSAGGAKISKMHGEYRAYKLK